MKIIFLGTGVPTIEANNIKAGACEIIQIGNNNLLFDCGRWASYQLIKSNVMPWTVNHIFFTHYFHFDHTCDYLTLILNSPRRKVRVYGPKGMKAWSDNLFKALGDVRVSQFLDLIEVNDVDEGLVCNGDGWKVTSVRTKHIGRTHTKDEPSLAYRVEEGEKSVVISGDVTVKDPEAYQANQELIKIAKGTEIFIMDADATHTTPEDMGIAARDSNAKKIILTHIQSPGSNFSRNLIWSDHNEILRRMKPYYKGEIIIAKDLLEIEV